MFGDGVANFVPLKIEGATGFPLQYQLSLTLKRQNHQKTSRISYV